MTSHAIPRFALASLAPALLLAAAPAHAQGAGDIPGSRYVVDNQTQGPLVCRYRVNPGTMGGVQSARWLAHDPIAAGGAFSRSAQGPGETLSLDCNPEGQGARPTTVRPGQRYQASKGDDGKVVVARAES